MEVIVPENELNSCCSLTKGFQFNSAHIDPLAVLSIITAVEKGQMASIAALETRQRSEGTAIGVLP